jgi:hypothetical protein
MRPLLYHGSLLALEFIARWWLQLALAAVALFIAAAAAATSHAQTIANALAQVNAARAARGVYALAPAADLQAQAELESIWRAQRGTGGHWPNGCSPGRAEGVGYQSGADYYGQEFNTCYHTSSKRRWQAGAGYTTSYRYAGAAVAVSPNGTSYYTLLLR